MCIIVENMAFVVNEMRDLLKIRAITSNIQEIQPKSERIIIKPAVKLWNCLVYVPHDIIPMLISSFVSILFMIYPIQMPKMYGDSRVHGLSYNPLKNVRLSSVTKLKEKKNILNMLISNGE